LLAFTALSSLVASFDTSPLQGKGLAYSPSTLLSSRTPILHSSTQTPPTMFGAFKPTAPLSGGLLWYRSLPSPPMLPFHLIPNPNLHAHPFPPVEPTPTNPSFFPPMQENPLAPLKPAKSAPAQTPPRRRRPRLDRLQRPGQAGLLGQGAREVAR